MAKLFSVCEQSWRQLNPNPGDEEAVTLEEFIATGRNEYALQLYIKARNEKRENGFFEVPSELLFQVERPVVNNEIDLSGLHIMKSIPGSKWLANIGGLTCSCSYVKSTVNTSALLCDDNSLEDDARTYYVIGDKIFFPRGTHKETLPIILASSGEDVNANIDIADDLAAIVRTRLIEIYGNKTGKEDESNNSASNS